MQMLENLDVWKKSSRLCVELYQSFAHCKDYGFKDQITRSSLSIPSNIAEGFERDSLKGRIQFLKIAKGSCGELWTQLLIAREIQYIDSEKCRKMEGEAKVISKMLYGLIRHYQDQITSN
jgi:four helix bundle protein